MLLALGMIFLYFDIYLLASCQCQGRFGMGWMGMVSVGRFSIGWKGMVSEGRCRIYCFLEQTLRTVSKLLLASSSL